MIVHGETAGQAYLLFVPAMCDMVATSLMYIGLTITSASSFQVRCIPGSVLAQYISGDADLINLLLKMT